MRGFYSGVLEFATFAAVVAAAKRTGVGIVTSILAVVGHVYTRTHRHTHVSTPAGIHKQTGMHTLTQIHTRTHRCDIYVCIHSHLHTHALTHVRSHAYATARAENRKRKFHLALECSSGRAAPD